MASKKLKQKEGVYWLTDVEIDGVSNKNQLMSYYAVK